MCSYWQNNLQSDCQKAHGILELLLGNTNVWQSSICCSKSPSWNQSVRSHVTMFRAHGYHVPCSTWPRSVPNGTMIQRKDKEFEWCIRIMWLSSRDVKLFSTFRRLHCLPSNSVHSQKQRGTAFIYRLLH